MQCFCYRCQEGLGSVFPEYLLSCPCSSEALWVPFTWKTLRDPVFIMGLVILLLKMLRDLRFGVFFVPWSTHWAHTPASLSEALVFELKEKISSETLIEKIQNQRSGVNGKHLVILASQLIVSGPDRAWLLLFCLFRGDHVRVRPSAFFSWGNAARVLALLVWGL